MKAGVESALDREIVSTRTLDLPRSLVFQAFSDPDHLAHWWGPRGFTNTFHAFDLRPGGVWTFVMHGPDGVRFYTRPKVVTTRWTTSDVAVKLNMPTLG